MSFAPLRLLFVAYGAAATAAGVGMALGLPLLAAALTLWIGGAVATLALAFAPATRRRFVVDRAGDEAAEEASIAASARRWEEERLAVEPSAEQARRDLG